MSNPDDRARAAIEYATRTLIDVDNKATEWARTRVEQAFEAGAIWARSTSLAAEVDNDPVTNLPPDAV